MNKTMKLMLSFAAALLLMLLAACGDIAEQNTLDSQIVGGSEAEPGAYPFMAKLELNGGPWCGGSLIERKWVLTAAHCVTGKSAGDFTVVLGEHTSGVDEGVEQKIRVSEIEVNPNYDYPDSDIALLELAKPAKLNDRVSTIKTRGLPSADTTLRVVGWGTIREEGPSSKTLRQVDVPVVSNSECEQTYPGSITKNMFCAGFSKGGKDSCQGDSGGPIFKGKRLVGIVSFGDGCARADAYGVYVKVSQFKKWISGITN